MPKRHDQLKLLLQYKIYHPIYLPIKLDQSKRQYAKFPASLIYQKTVQPTEPHGLIDKDLILK